MSMKMDPLQKVLADAKGLAERLKRGERPQLTPEQRAQSSGPTPVQKSDAERAKLREHPSGFGK